MSAQAGPGPSTSFYMQAQKQNGNNTNNNAPIGNAGTSGAANNNGSVLAPIGGTAEDVAPGEPNTFTDAQLEEFKEQDRYLPIANVGRIMKNALPSNAKIAKEAKECVQECVSEFISFLSSEAADKVGTDKRKTINGEDILYAMTALGFDNYQEAGRVYLAKYRNYINEHPHRPSHHERTVPPSAQTSNRNTPLQTPITDDLLDPSSFLNQSPDESFAGDFNAFVNEDIDGPGDGEDDGEELDADAETGGLTEGNAGGKAKSKKASASGKKSPAGGGKRKGGASGAGPPEKKAKTKGAGAAAATAAGKKSSKK